MGSTWAARMAGTRDAAPATASTRKMTADSVAASVGETPNSMPDRTRAKAEARPQPARQPSKVTRDRKSTRLNSSHGYISYAVFCLKKKKKHILRKQSSRNTHDISIS